MTTPIIHWRTTWRNGDPTYWLTFSNTTESQQRIVEQIADESGFKREGNGWKPPETRQISPFFERSRALGFLIDFEGEDEDAPLDLERLKLTDVTRRELVSLKGFLLSELAGWCPVQASGVIDGVHWYFRARGTYWRFEAGGNESGTRGPTWWHEEEWPSTTGFEAGYMDDEDAVKCILKSVKAYSTEDRSRFERGHHDYERTTLEGWALGALSLRRAVRRLSITGKEAIERSTAYGIELPYGSERELELLAEPSSTVWGLDRITGEWIEMQDEDK